MDTATLLKLDTSTGVRPPVFLALDSRIARLSAQAAVEFDWLVQNKHGKHVKATQESINMLHTLLAGAVEIKRFMQNKGYIDSLGLNLFAGAYNQTYLSHPVRTSQDLQGAIHDLMCLLKKIEDGVDIDENDLVNMRTFCVALSERASTYRQMISGRPVEHPYEKGYRRL